MNIFFQVLSKLCELLLIVGLGISSITCFYVGYKVWKTPKYEYDKIRERLLRYRKIDERDIDKVLM